MGFLRGVGYFFCILLIIGGLVLLYANPIFGIPVIVLGIILIWALRKSGQVASMQKDMRYIADLERAKVKGISDGEKELEDLEKEITEGEKRLAELEREKQKRETDNKK